MNRVFAPEKDHCHDCKRFIRRSTEYHYTMLLEGVVQLFCERCIAPMYEQAAHRTARSGTFSWQRVSRETPRGTARMSQSTIRADIRNRHTFPGYDEPERAIARFCVECMGGEEQDAIECGERACFLWPEWGERIRGNANGQ